MPRPMVTSEDIFGDDETQATPVPVSSDSDDEDIVHDDAEVVLVLNVQRHRENGLKRTRNSRLSNIMKRTK